MKEILSTLCAGHHLNEEKSEQLADSMFENALAPEVVAAVLVALRTKGETVDELVGFARSMRKHAVLVPNISGAVDTCGTGGDGSRTFNISTAAGFVVAACGVRVAKAGNRSASSVCGSADVLEALGANINPGSQATKNMIQRVGFGFLFAPAYHPAMKNVASVRKALGIKTIFNLLGPLTNPANVKVQVIGAYDSRAQGLIADAAKRLGTDRTLVIHGQGADEALLGRTRILDVRPEGVREYGFLAEDFGIQGNLEELIVQSVTQSAHMLKEALTEDSLKSRVVALNAALALFAAGKNKTVKEAYAVACDAIQTGAASDKLHEYVEASQA